MQRTKNAVRNIIFGFINKAVVLIGPFIIRTILIRKLGSEYLGLSSLFTSILQVLNLTELGFSSAITFSMYKPIAENDTDTICALMNLYKKTYRIIGCVILVIGIAITPFISNFINGSYPDDINIYILYLLYLFNTASTYFLFAYKSALLNACQRNDVVSNVNTFVYLIQYVIQGIILCVLGNYYLYVVVAIVMGIINNLWCAHRASKMYPQYIPKGKISKELNGKIKKQVSGLMIQKVCTTTRNSFDSIFISAFIGLSAVAIYSNYYSIMNAIIGILGIITTSITAGVGNSIVTESVEKNHNDLRKFNFIFMIIAGWCTICLACLYQPFMKIWMGEEYMFSYGVVLLLCLYFYVLKMGDIRSVYTTSKGLWYESRFRSIAETVANLVLNIVLGRLFGVYGIIAGTLISMFIINFLYGSQIVYRYYFGKGKIKSYFEDHAIYAIVTAVIALITYGVCVLVPLEGIVGLLIKCVICVIVPVCLYFLVYCKTKRFKEAKNFLLGIIKK